MGVCIPLLDTSPDAEQERSATLTLTLQGAGADLAPSTSINRPPEQTTVWGGCHRYIWGRALKNHSSTASARK